MIEAILILLTILLFFITPGIPDELIPLALLVLELLGGRRGSRRRR